VKKKRFDPTAD